MSLSVLRFGWLVFIGSLTLMPLALGAQSKTTDSALSTARDIGGVAGLRATFATAGAVQDAPTANAQNGERVWRRQLCVSCHGSNAEGGFGPDLAGGRGLTFEQFKHAIYKPWGVMLSYTSNQVSEKEAADLFAFVTSKPRVSQPGEWLWRAAPADAPLGQRLQHQVVGCGQCHEPELKYPRMRLGAKAKDVTFEYFAASIYNHTDRYPKGSMGNYSRDRLPEIVLREIYKHLIDLGLRPWVMGALAIGQTEGKNTTYELTITNMGIKDKGLTAEEMTIFVKLPNGTTVVRAAGPGYVGVKSLSAIGLEPALALAPHPHDDSGRVERPKQELSGQVALWKVPQISAGDRQQYSLTLSDATPTAELLQGFAGSTVYWEKPGRGAAGSPPALVYRDLRMPDKGDHERISIPAPPTRP